MPLKGPPKNEFRGMLSIALVGTLWFAIVYGSCSWHWSLQIPTLSLVMPWERLIPFWPSWSWVYLSINVLMPMSLLCFKNKFEMLRFVKLCSLQIAIAGIFFWFLPVTPPFEPNPFEYDFFYKFALVINLEGNFFPSLHVGLSLFASFVFASKVNGIWRIFFILWGVLIVGSTLLIHEHSVVDVLGGVVLAGLTWFLNHSLGERANANLPLDETL